MSIGPEIVLASASPRRAELLQRLGLPFRVQAPEVDETFPPQVPPEEGLVEVARRKLEKVRQILIEPGYVLAADTIVLLGSKRLGKPADAHEARAFLRLLAGRSHRVATAVAAVGPSGTVQTGSASTDVTFAPLSIAQIDAYVATGEPLGKAGAYAVQGQAAAFVRDIRGEYSNIVGLPLRVTLDVLHAIGYPLPPHLRPS